MNAAVVAVQVAHVVDGIAEVHGFGHLLGGQNLDVGIFAQREKVRIGDHDPGIRIKALRRNGLVLFPERTIALTPRRTRIPVEEGVHKAHVAVCVHLVRREADGLQNGDDLGRPVKAVFHIVFARLFARERDLDTHDELQVDDASDVEHRTVQGRANDFLIRVLSQPPHALLKHRRQQRMLVVHAHAFSNKEVFLDIGRTEEQEAHRHVGRKVLAEKLVELFMLLLAAARERLAFEAETQRLVIAHEDAMFIVDRQRRNELLRTNIVGQQPFIRKALELENVHTSTSRWPLLTWRPERVQLW